MNSFDFSASALRTIRAEALAIQKLSNHLPMGFTNACQILLSCQGRVIIIGMGKSGHIGKKIAATLSCTGTPAFFVHPGEASHGDMGMITNKDVVIALSNSGESQEILCLIPLIKHMAVPLISITSNAESNLAISSDAHLNTFVNIEACPLNLTPTSSTTATLVLGDAIAIALLEARGFTAKDFALSHPGGELAKKLKERL